MIIYVSSGVVSSGVTLTGDSMFVGSGGITYETSVNSGGFLAVSHGGIANSVSVNSRGSCHILSGGIANSVSVNSRGQFRVSNGGIANSVSVDSWGDFDVYSGGTANFTAIHSRGSCHILSGGVANSVSVDSWGSLYVYSGGSALNVNWTPCQGSITVQEGGVITYTSQHSGVYYGSGNILLSHTASMNGKVISGFANSMYVMSGGVANSTINSLGILYVMSGGAVNSTILSGGSAWISSGGTANFTAINNGGNFYVSSGGTANFISVNSGANVHIFNGGTAVNIVENGGFVNVAEGAEVTFTPNTISGLVLSGYATLHSGTVANSTVILGLPDHGGTCHPGELIVSSGGKANFTLVSGFFDSVTWTEIYGQLTISRGGVANATILSSGCLHVYNGGTHRGTLHIAAMAVVSAYAGSIIDFTVAGRTGEDGYLINDLSLISGNPTYTITVDADQAAGTYLLAQGASAFTGTLSIGTEEINFGSITVNGDDFVYNDITYSLDQVDGNLTLTIGGSTPPVTPSIIEGETIYIPSGSSIESATVNSRGAIVLSSGATAKNTIINSAGALHVYNGGVASQTTVNQSGYLGIGLGATAYDTTIGYAGELTVWGGGVVSRNTIDTWGAIILSSGALAKDSIVNSLGGLHVYSGAVASNTTIKEGGVLGAGYGATVYETKLDSFGKATLWGGAVASNTSVGYAAELTVLSGGLADTNVIDTWGAVILSSGAIGNSTTILANGGYHIYKGATAYTTMVTSGANLGIGFGGTVYNLKIETGAKATFYDGSILRGWSDFAGTVTVNAGVDAADSMINFDITQRSTTDGVIISNAAGISEASFFITIDANQEQGRYYLAGNAGNIISLAITGTDKVLSADGGLLFLDNKILAMGYDSNDKLFVDIARISGSAEDWDAMDLGSWDEIETGAAAPLMDGAEEKKANGFLAIA